MIITRSELIPEKNVGAFAWGRLKRFHNVSYVANIIADEQKTPARHKDNVRKQAEQVRYCLQQAQEYFEASKIVSLATKPTLLYYSLMSPALAELLMKQSGDSSLDRAREQHRHHGLVPNIQPPRGGVTMLDVVAGSMSASPLLHDGVVEEHSSYGTRRRGDIRLQDSITSHH